MFSDQECQPISFSINLGQESLSINQQAETLRDRTRRNKRYRGDITTILQSQSEYGSFPDIDNDPDESEEDQNQEGYVVQEPEAVQNFEIPQNLLFMRRKFTRQNKNTPRYLTRLAVKYLKKYQSEYPPHLYQIVVEECKKLQDWHSQEKKNVYLINHLKHIFSNDEIFTKEGTRLNRRVFRKIIQKYGFTEMDEPRSQVKEHKIDYFRACKVFSLRCMNANLVQRNQTK